MCDEDGLKDNVANEFQDCTQSEDINIENNNIVDDDNKVPIENKVVSQNIGPVEVVESSGEEPAVESIGNFEIIKEIRSIKDDIRNLCADNEMYMSRRDTIDALKSSFENALSNQDLNNRRPLVRIAANTYDKYEKLCKATHERKDELSVEDVLRSFDNFIVEIENILISLGVNQFDDVGQALDPHNHDVVKVVYTEDSSLDKTIAENISYGYIGEGIMIKQKVSVYKYKGAE